MQEGEEVGAEGKTMSLVLENIWQGDSGTWIYLTEDITLDVDVHYAKLEPLNTLIM